MMLTIVTMQCANFRITKRIIMIGLLAGGIVLAVACILVALLVDVKSVLMGKKLSVTTTLPSLLANAAAIIPGTARVDLNVKDIHTSLAFTA